MICNNCGTEIPDNSAFCNVCGQRIENFKATYDTVQVVTPKQINTSADSHSEQWTSPEKPVVKKKGGKVALIIIAVIAAMLVVGTVMFFFVYKAKTSNGLTGQKADKGLAPSVEITYCPESITGSGTTLDMDIEGTVFDSDSSCTVTVNGNEVLDKTVDGVVTNWTATVTLYEGENEIIVRAQDDNGNFDSQTKKVSMQVSSDQQSAQDIAYGTVFINAYSDSAIFVRREPKKSGNDDYLLKISAGDTNTELVYLGQTQKDSENYDWLYVKIPTGEKGWVRCDIVVEK